MSKIVKKYRKMSKNVEKWKNIENCRKMSRYGQKMSKNVEKCRVGMSLLVEKCRKMSSFGRKMSKNVEFRVEKCRKLSSSESKIVDVCRIMSSFVEVADGGDLCTHTLASSY